MSFNGLFYLFSASCLLPRAFPAEIEKYFLCEWVKFFQQKEQEKISAASNLRLLVQWKVYLLTQVRNGNKITLNHSSPS